jgi:serine/threonine-protein kinase RsbT
MRRCATLATLVETTHHQKILEVLCKYASEPTARGMLKRAIGQVEIGANGGRDLPRLLERLDFGVRLFIENDKHAALQKELWQLVPNDDARSEGIRIDTERDACRARMLARSMAIDAGAKPLVALKMATAVSELARNALMYAGGGDVEIEVQKVPLRRVRVTVTDQGEGITDLERVLAGTYESRTGMGRGLLGVKRMADAFDIQTGKDGTLIRFEMTY